MHIYCTGTAIWADHGCRITVLELQTFQYLCSKFAFVLHLKRYKCKFIALELRNNLIKWMGLATRTAPSAVGVVVNVYLNSKKVVPMSADCNWTSISTGLDAVTLCFTTKYFRPKYVLREWHIFLDSPQILPNSLLGDREWDEVKSWVLYPTMECISAALLAWTWQVAIFFKKAQLN